MKQWLVLRMRLLSVWILKGTIKQHGIIRTATHVKDLPKDDLKNVIVAIDAYLAHHKVPEWDSSMALDTMDDRISYMRDLLKRWDV